MKSLAKHGMLLAVCFALSLPGCGGGKTSEDGKAGDDKKTTPPTLDQSSPQKVAESFKNAVSQNDWKTALACVTDESQERILLIFKKQTDRAVGDSPEKKKSLKDVLKKHGVKEEGKSAGAMPFLDVKDKAAFLADLSNWLKENPPAGAEKGFTARVRATEFSNFKTDGDKATAEASVGGEKIKTPLEFRKVDEKWYLVVTGGPGGKNSGPAPFPKTN